MADVPAVAHLFGEEIGTAPIISRLEHHVRWYPSVVAHLGEALVGFVLTRTFAPDILEVSNMLVSPEHRNRGIGGELLGHLERAARSDVMALILGNSMLWPSAAGEKQSAESFYVRHGFLVVFRTPQTVVMTKYLDA